MTQDTDTEPQMYGVVVVHGKFITVPSKFADYFYMVEAGKMEDYEKNHKEGSNYVNCCQGMPSEPYVSAIVSLYVAEMMFRYDFFYLGKGTQEDIDMVSALNHIWLENKNKSDQASPGMFILAIVGFSLLVALIGGLQ